MPARSLLLLSLFAAASASAQIAAPTAPAPDPHPSLRAGVLAGFIGVPRPLSAELFFKLYDLVGVGAGYSALPSGVSDLILSAANVKDVTASSSAIEGDLRVFPFRGSFFVGSSLGRQTLTASATRSGQTVNVDMTTVYAAPRLGWLGIWNSGFSLSFDAGVQLPLSTDATVTGGNPDAQSTAQSAARSLGNQPLPSVNLRLGFFL